MVAPPEEAEVTTDVEISGAYDAWGFFMAFGDVGFEISIAGTYDTWTSSATLDSQANTGLAIAGTYAAWTSEAEFERLYLEFKPGFAYYQDPHLLGAVAWARGPGSQSMWAGARKKLTLTDVINFEAPRTIATVDLDDTVVDLASDTSYLAVVREDGVVEVRNNTQEAPKLAGFTVPGTPRAVAFAEAAFGYHACAVAFDGGVTIAELDAAGAATVSTFPLGHGQATAVWLEIAPAASAVVYTAGVYTRAGRIYSYTVSHVSGREARLCRAEEVYESPNLTDAFQPFDKQRQLRYLTSESAGDGTVVVPSPAYNVIQQFETSLFEDGSQTRYDWNAVELRNADIDDDGDLILHTDNQNDTVALPSIWLPRKFYRRLDGGYAFCHPQVGAVSRVMPEGLRDEQLHYVGDTYNIITVYTAEWDDGWTVTSSTPQNTLLAASDSGWESTREVDAFRVQRTIIRDPDDTAVTPDPPATATDTFDMVVANRGAEDLFFFEGTTPTTFTCPFTDGIIVPTTWGLYAFEYAGDGSTRNVYRNTSYGITSDDWELVGVMTLPIPDGDNVNEFDFLGETHDGYLLFHIADRAYSSTLLVVVETKDPTIVVSSHRQPSSVVLWRGVCDNSGYVFFEGTANLGDTVAAYYLKTPYTGDATKIEVEVASGATPSFNHLAVRASDGLVVGVNESIVLYGDTNHVFVQDTPGDPTSWSWYDDGDLGLVNPTAIREIIAVGDTFYLAGETYTITFDGFVATKNGNLDGTSLNGSSWSWTARGDGSVERALTTSYTDGTWTRENRVATSWNPADGGVGCDVLRPIWPPPW